MKYIIKLGGMSLGVPGLNEASVRAIADLARDGNKVAVVHGGGAQLTRALMVLGKTNELVNGVRVTDVETRDTALMVLAGQVNKGLVAALGAVGQPALGMTGGDGPLFRARRKRTAPDLGYVGEIAASDPRWLDAIWNLGSVPVLSSMALGFDGCFYVVNADEMAAACAIACRADALVFLTDVSGVRDAEGQVMRWLSISQIVEMEKTAVISGGMLPKLAACREALLNGVRRVRILPADAVSTLPDLCNARVAHGTEVMVA